MCYKKNITDYYSINNRSFPIELQKVFYYCDAKFALKQQEYENTMIPYLWFIKQALMYDLIDDVIRLISHYLFLIIVY